MSASATSTPPARAAGTTARWRLALRRLWQGGASAFRPRTAVAALIVASLLPALYALGLGALRWTMPLKAIGGVCILLLILALLWLVRVCVSAVLRLGMKRIVIVTASVYVIAVAVLGLMSPGDLRSPSFWLTVAGDVAAGPLMTLQEVSAALMIAPDEIRFAATSERLPLRPPDATWVEGAPPQPIEAAGIPAAGGAEDTAPASQPPAASDSTAPALAIGDQARIVGTDGAALRVRAEPSTGAAIIARVPAGNVVRLEDGPVTADGYTWWRVRGAAGTGWSAANYLERVAPER